ncbi:50S ribosomal protein L18 [Clostridium botulinum]|uniref:Large ribosomal subunit protein uL18 n=1 Tax=Clostridium botulinum C/D str. DC5 TaxID=1443128 RepID=A0A0A0I6P5_CLOBO|nr:50S ribosomal protein L18 [Clostridium botulinum]KEI05015.1 50S ribosomal protein L18 [Clostridium botulinum C/D str. BKT75002]KEI11859.1 50S ribosomal protein L18 [Clostridium botulinum C/D str. BKT2873]KGM93927.1 50S ribosomal protein L18 [Clostridium botulinum D str. CCUG 7971]KGM96537.1 50S ribosomal protein L18 [Clostridium botulinum C/D str. DC5]KOC46419.1 50S ribosomal protein L18 [Clostridium botulinum]
MFKKENRQRARVKRHLRVRNKISGTAQRPRLAVFRSEKNIYAQIIDDVERVTIVSASSLDKDFADKIGSNKEAAKAVGTMVAKKAIEKGIEEVVFDRGGYVYHGRVKELAEAAREAGLKF